jgi:hypothetical protein
MMALAELREQGFVKVESGLLLLDALYPTEWLTSSLANGESDSWRICDAYPKRAQKFQPDQVNLDEIGKAGEEYVVSWLRAHLDESLHAQVLHTSETDDSAGYDISTVTQTLPGKVLLEIKTSTRPGPDFTFHLTRNEFNTARMNSNWFLILVRRIGGKCTLFGYLDSVSLVSYFPKDNHSNFRWESTVGMLGEDDIFEGLPGFKFSPAWN